MKKPVIRSQERNTMQLITKRDRIRAVPLDWTTQYPEPKETLVQKFPGETTDDVYHQLLALDLDHCTETEVTNIIGNNTWTELVCDSCGSDSEAVIDLDDGERFFWICRDCVEKAGTLFTDPAQREEQDKDQYQEKRRGANP